jgi:elongation factor 2
MFTFADEIRSETQGRALWSVEYAGYELLPRELQETTIKQIRERKGLPPEPPTAKDFMEM